VKIRTDQRSKAAVAELKQAISSGCYSRAPQGTAGLPCDPLVSWQLIVGTPGAQAR
jgi:hypothetical protein